MRRMVVLLLVTVAFAGCTESPQETDGASADEAEPVAIACTVESNTPECSGTIAISPTLDCPDGAASCTCETGDERYRCIVEAEDAVVETPVEWTGHTKEGVWLLCGGPGVSNPLPIPIPSGCIGQQIQPDGAYQNVEQYEWELTGVDLTLEWTAADATQTGLALNIQDRTGGTNLGTWEGSSSFTVDAELSAPYDPETLDYELLFQVWPVAKDGGNNYIDVTQQEFTLTGNILSTHIVFTNIMVEPVDESS